MMEKELEKLIRLMKERFALDISVYDNSFLEKTVKDRLIATSRQTVEDYLVYLGGTPGETACLIGQLSNSYSEFFRNPLTFSMLEQAVIPKIFSQAEKTKSGEIRVWSAGCASGQEPYSLAMLLDDYKNNHQSDISYRIFATDSSEKELDGAKKGVFDRKTVKNTRLEFAEKHFRKSGENYILNSRLKKQVDFSHFDLLDKDSSSPPSGIYGDFDLIMCCNVLFYYQPEYQQMILQKFSRSLKSGGFLVTGEAEAHLVNSHRSFRQYAAPAPVFVKI